MATKEIYPTWKKVAWRFGRVFVAGYGATLALFMTNLKEIPTLEQFYVMALLPAFVAGINALGKAIREYFENGQMRKLPI